MKLFLILVIIVGSALMASDIDKEKKSRTEQQVKKEMEKEKKYSIEQTFYQGKHYDLKGAEVNKDSLSTVAEIPVDDFNMDSVYD